MTVDHKSFMSAIQSFGLLLLLRNEHKLQVQKTQERGLIQAIILARKKVPTEQQQKLQKNAAEKDRRLIRALISAREGKQKKVLQSPELAMEVPRRGPLIAK